jgi:hypothetical protein
MKKALLLGIFMLVVSSITLADADTSGQGLYSGDDDYTYPEDGVSDDDDDDDDEEEDEEHEPDQYRDDEGTVWIQSEIMTVRLDSDKPTYQYWYTADDNGSLTRFMVSFLMIVEFEDNNTDGVFQANETIAFAPLDAFEWSLQTGTITNEAGQNVEVYASYTKGGMSEEDVEDDWFEDWIPGYHDDAEDAEDGGEEDEEDEEDDYDFSMFEDMTLQFYGHVYMDDYNGTVSDDEGVKANYTVLGGVELKIDIEIGNFPYLSNTSKIAVLNYLREDIASSDDYDYEYHLHEDDDDYEIDSDEDMEDLGEEFEDEDHDDDDEEVQEISLVEGSTNVTRGLYRWVDQALMTHLNGTQEAVDVRASYWTNGEGLLLFMAYPNFNGGSLLHDPSMRLIEEAGPSGQPPVNVPIPSEYLVGTGIAVVALVLVGVALKRR